MTTLILVLGLYYYAPVVLEQSVHEINSRRFQMPVHMDANARKACAGIRLWVSEDRGKSWKLNEEIDADGTLFKFTAARDGHYWFALQVVQKAGNFSPPKIDSHTVDQKVYVNADRRTVIHQRIAAKPAWPPPPNLPAQPANNVAEKQKDREPK